MTQSVSPKPRFIKVGNSAVDKRSGKTPVPLNLRSLLSEQQLMSVQQMTHFGWHLAFVRRDELSNPVVVVANGSENRFAVLSRDGVIDTSADVSVREAISA